MILDRITLCNFGVFEDQHVIELTPPSSKKPIVLFWGLNGTGKTTLMEAFQLCLFGRAAKCASGNGGSYKEFIENRIRSSSPKKQASVSVNFRCTANGEENTYCVTRTWHKKRKHTQEELSVTRNERSDHSLTEHWNQFVDEFIPANISHLFFVDGENISTYATPRQIRDLIGEGVQNLFGLDVIDRLRKDLQILERRNRTAIMDSEIIEEIRQKEKALLDLHEQVNELEKNKTTLQTTELILAKNDLASVIEEYKKIGGELRDRSDEIEYRVMNAEKRLRACNLEMVELASGEFPLVLVRQLLDALSEQVEEERETTRARATLENLQQHDKEILNLLKTFPNTENAIVSLQQLCQSNLEQFITLASRETPFNLSDRTINQLNSILEFKFPSFDNSMEQILVAQRDAQIESNEARLEQAGIPAEDVVEELIKKRNALTIKITELEDELSGINFELEVLHKRSDRLQYVIDSLWESNAKQEMSNKDVERFIHHSQMARQTLADLSEAKSNLHIERLEQLALDSFQSLLRKDRLISSLQIDPKTYAVQFRDLKQVSISPEQLSAGERQLLVVALMWGMAQVSGRLLPVAIDSPMGRLDSTHRMRLVENYFPYASHQTLIFTTDEEISGDYLSHLDPWVGRRYDLIYDDFVGSTTISTKIS